MTGFWAVVGVLGACAALWLVAWHLARWRKTHREKGLLREARMLFRRRREWLEAEFVTLASEIRKPRDFVWASCDFDDEVAFARDRNNGQLRALVGATVRLESEDGLTDEQGETLVAIRLATAVFRFDNGTWTSDGRTIFNMNPAETIERYGHELEVVD